MDTFFSSMKKVLKMLLKKGNCHPKMLSFLHGQVGIIFGTMLEILVHLIFLANAGLRVLLYSQELGNAGNISYC